MPRADIPRADMSRADEFRVQNQGILVQDGPKRRGRGRQRGNANEFGQYAEEATSWARRSKAKEEEQALIELAPQGRKLRFAEQEYATARRSTGPRKARAGDTRPSSVGRAVKSPCSRSVRRRQSVTRRSDPSTEQQLACGGTELSAALTGSWQ